MTQSTVMTASTSLKLASFLALTFFLVIPAFPFGPFAAPSSTNRMAATTTEPKINIAQKIVDLHDKKATFDFCGGMMFQLVLSDKLRDELLEVAKKGETDIAVFDASVDRMAKMSKYTQSAEADGIQIFHGREVRKVPNAAGGMGFVLHLSSASSEDPEGWTPQEKKEYNGWTHDSGRHWRRGDDLLNEGYNSFRSKFGPSAFTLHHRFYWHVDQRGGLWLAAEDGCEGVVRSW